MGKVVFVLGLQGVGKTAYIREHHPQAIPVDYEHWWLSANKNYPEMDVAEKATWVKCSAMVDLANRVMASYETVTVEATGMSKVNQAGIMALVNLARSYGYQVEIVYLRPLDWNVYIESIDGNEGALDMFRAWSRRRPGDQWREPTECPYFGDVTLVGVDYTHLPARGPRFERIDSENLSERMAA